MKYTKQAGIIFLLFTFFYVYYRQDPQSNGNTRIGLIFAIVQERRLTIDSYQDAEGTRTIDKAYYNGHYYTDKAIGSSLLGVVAYAPIYLFMKLTGRTLDLIQIKYLLTVLVISLPSAFAGSLVYVLCEYISRSRLRALLATLAVTLGTMVLPFSAIFFGHQLAGAILFTAFFLIFQLKVKPDLRHKLAYLLLIGFLLGAAFITEFTTAVIILPLCLYYVYILRERLTWRWLRTMLLPFALGALIPAVILMTYNTLCFGSPFSIGYENLGNQYKESMQQGLMGIGLPKLSVLYYLTFHPTMGLFWQSPVLLMSLMGLYFVIRDPRYRLEGLLVLISLLGYLLVNAGYYMWWGGYSFAPRHLIPMLLFLSIPLALLPRRLVPLVIILAVISIGQMLLPLANTNLVPDTLFIRDGRPVSATYSTIYSYDLQQLRMGNFNPNLGSKLLGLQGWMTLLPLILAILAVCVGFVWYEAELHRRRLAQEREPQVK